MKERGCVGVDMELSALLAVAKYRQIKFFEFLIGEDAVDSEAKEPLDRNNPKIFNSALKILNNL